MPPQPGVIVQDGRNPSPPRTSWNGAGKKPGRPKGLTNSKKRERDKQIVRDRLVNDLSWGALALRHDLDERYALPRGRNRIVTEADHHIEVNDDELRVLHALDDESDWLDAHVTFLCRRRGCDAAVVEEASILPAGDRPASARAWLPDRWSYEASKDDPHTWVLLCPEHRGGRELDAQADG